MPRQELLQELRIREQELLIELKAIQTLLGSEHRKESIDKPLEPIQLIRPEKEPYPVNSKGDKSWDAYLISILKEMGGKARSKDMAELIIKANPKIRKDRIWVAVRQHLSMLHKNSKINAVKSEIKSQGYEYYL